MFFGSQFFQTEKSDEQFMNKIVHIVAGQEKPHMCIWPLNMYLLQNIQEELSEISYEL